MTLYQASPRQQGLDGVPVAAVAEGKLIRHRIAQAGEMGADLCRSRRRPLDGDHPGFPGQTPDEGRRAAVATKAPPGRPDGALEFLFSHRPESRLSERCPRAAQPR